MARQWKVNKRSNSELDSLPRCRKQRTPEMWSHHPGLNAAEHSVGNAIQWCTDTSDPRHFGPTTLRHYVFGANAGVSDSSAQKCMRPRIKSCLQCCHSVKRCRPTLYSLYTLMEWKCLAIRLTKAVSKSRLISVSSHTLVATKVIGR